MIGSKSICNYRSKDVRYWQTDPRTDRRTDQHPTNRRRWEVLWGSWDGFWEISEGLRGSWEAWGRCSIKYFDFIPITLLNTCVMQFMHFDERILNQPTDLRADVHFMFQLEVYKMTTHPKMLPHWHPARIPVEKTHVHILCAQILSRQMRKKWGNKKLKTIQFLKFNEV